jgi:hypothetical protein
MGDGYTTRRAGLPSNYVNARPDGPLEQLDGGGLANTAGAADEDGDKVLDAVALCVTGPHGLAGNHLKWRAGKEEVGHGIDGRTVSTTQSGRRVKQGGCVVLCTVVDSSASGAVDCPLLWQASRTKALEAAGAWVILIDEMCTIRVVQPAFCHPRLAYQQGNKAISVVVLLNCVGSTPIPGSWNVLAVVDVSAAVLSHLACSMRLDIVFGRLHLLLACLHVSHVPGIWWSG